MEKIQHLIDRLVEQKGSGENISQLINTVQQLHQELVNWQQAHSAAGSSKVAVIMPGNGAWQSIEAGQVQEQKPLVLIPEKDKRFIPTEPIAVEKYKQRVEPELAETKEWNLPQQSSTSTPEVVAAQKLNPATISSEVFSLPQDEVQEAPTLTQYHGKQKELHEVIAENKKSLNDLLKEEKPELGSILKEAPIKDLRKGIGLNDKFLFISELFRGDEIMYERSIKTINGFHILPEAEYWINRELKVKQGWNDSKDAVQHFYGVVRRRFS